MTTTCPELCVRHRLDTGSPTTTFPRVMLDRYDASGFLAAFNAGPARYDEHFMKGRPLTTETPDDVANLAPMISAKQGKTKKASRPIASATCLLRRFPRTELHLRALSCLQAEHTRIVPRLSVTLSIFRRPRRVAQAVSCPWRAMACISLNRTLEEHIAGSGSTHVCGGGSDHGLQDKSAAVGRGACN